LTVWCLQKEAPDTIDEYEEKFDQKFVAANLPVSVKLVKSESGDLTTGNLVFTKSASLLKRKVSERSERALKKTRTHAMDLAEWLQT